MGHQNIIYGYIEIDSSRVSNDRKVLESTDFSNYPFLNIFSVPHDGYLSSIISFAGSYKTLEEDFDNWQEGFEKFLNRLSTKTAKLHVENELDGEVFSIDYFKDVEKGGPSSEYSFWVKWIKKGDSIEEIEYKKEKLTL